MTQAEMELYRERLTALKRRLGSDLLDLQEEALRGVGGEASGGLSDVPVHPADLGTDNYAEAVTLGLVANEDQLLEEVNDALARIEQGTFGCCEECGQEIPQERLEALPYARYCLRCARRVKGTAGK